MRRAGFTLIELLIVLGILGVMALAVIPSFGGMGSLKVSLAAKDALRLMRYARKVAIQTQQPVTVAFSPGQIRVSVDGDEPAEDGAEAEAAREPEDDKPKQRRDSDRLEETDPESFNLTRACEEVAFAFVQYDDSLASAEKGQDFRRRVAGQDDEDARKQEGDSFTVTVRANGTTRPFTMRVYGRDGDTPGDTLSFDFLCAGTIADD
ncbi:MAG TPA: prepilin-type N-terminal cleavage/methylation domain-containing protein [Candidatus Spyradenecus faecavium]|uniref:Prepilin-type N-terminal cleavage/methylation domain-containing protein n=1 Tax=Candidatus Spyradenecus faecavium TaxID=2840947 RepID=A0A9D1NPK5_9BACT|nr:prepilin-type N-terminal cleavage/methylation domain-containing protein [Candidatus Spyradenecus faecavium]